MNYDLKKSSILTIVLSAVMTFAQSREPYQIYFSYTDLNGNPHREELSGSLPYFKLDKFMLGWHWGGSFKLSKSLFDFQFLRIYLWF